MRARDLQIDWMILDLGLADGDGDDVRIHVGFNGAWRSSRAVGTKAAPLSSSRCNPIM
jgi:hypothetical protein